MRSLATSLFLIAFACLCGYSLTGCENWELPGKKTQRECVKPGGLINAQIQQLQVDFSIGSNAGTIDQVIWNFGNGNPTTTTGLTTRYTYPAPGEYVVKVVLTNSCGLETELSRTVTVSNATTPAVTVQPVTELSPTSATVRMAVTSTGNANLTRYGICYSSSNQNPEYDKDATQNINGTVAINTPVSFSLTNLLPNTRYYVRSFAVNATGRAGYSSTVDFLTYINPSVAAVGVPNAAVTTATVNFIINSPGNPAATSYGICYSPTNSTPDVSNSPTVNIDNPAINVSVPVNLTGLQPNTRYYYRPFARVPNGGIVYGNINQFTTQLDAVAQDLIASIPFTDGSRLDVSGFDNHIILVGNPTFTTDHKGRANSAILLNGSNYFFMNDNITLRPDALSISIWVRPGASADRMQIFNKSRFSDGGAEMYSSQIRPNDNGPGIAINTDIKQNSNCAGGVGWQSLSLASNIPLNTWYHIVLTYTGRTARMYINGTEFSSNTNLPASSIDNCPGGELKFGAQNRIIPWYFNGAMDDIRIYRRALTESEVKTLSEQ
ncbi:LamG-like jellyroll fold domain-containing protein [Spirosoma montaniterrae]|uniref:PKD domain-containing protein n=1 Tax=Spirosoma montaniterrae TaxID=1178516 RepID=A0A1P9X3F4_9BACT|nr:LamG-like jellyroll fold domain-containing protein [Spirosoma montaniterrae]AQG82153.1 hypothetical protein AWR27_24375 [Spirosoma montaniterrae]